VNFHVGEFESVSTILQETFPVSGLPTQPSCEGSAELGLEIARESVQPLFAIVSKGRPQVLLQIAIMCVAAVVCGSSAVMRSIRGC
jgi:hypothetical protein